LDEVFVPPMLGKDGGTYKTLSDELSPSPLAQHSSPVGQRYQREVGLQRWPSQWLGPRLGPFWPVHANEDPHLLPEEVTKRGEVFGG
jgi:hypothetical protein